MKQEDTRRRIMTAALRLFAQNGYEAVSVGQIAGAVGIKAPSLYKHYRSKRDIFDSIIEFIDRQDIERAREFAIPDGDMEDLARAYRQTPIETIRAYSEALFLHWTEEELSSDFRRMLTLEQYRSPAMAELYAKYLSREPLEYMSRLFALITGDEEDAFQIALEFYGPIYLLYSVYDSTGDRQSALDALHRHIDRFSARLQAANG